MAPAASPEIRKLIQSGWSWKDVYQLPNTSVIAVVLPKDCVAGVTKLVERGSYVMSAKFQKSDTKHAVMVLAMEPTGKAPNDFYLLIQDMGVSQ